MQKPFILVLTICFSMAFSPAQAQQQLDKLRAQAMENTRLLANRIALDDARSMRVRHLTYERLVQESQINTLYADDADVRQAKLRVAAQEYTDKLKELLTDAQFQRYLALSGPMPAPSGISVVQPAASPQPAAH